MQCTLLIFRLISLKMRLLQFYVILDHNRNESIQTLFRRIVMLDFILRTVEHSVEIEQNKKKLLAL